MDGTRIWEQHLQGAPLTVPLPTDRLRAPGNGCAAPVSHPVDSAADVDVLTALTAMAILLYRYSGETDVVLGRHDSCGLRVLRVAVSGGQTVAQLRTAVASAVARADRLGPIELHTLQAVRTPVDGQGAAPLHGLVLTGDTDTDPTRHADLALALVGGSVRLIAGGDVFSTQTVARVAGHMANLLAALAKAETTVDRLGLLDSTERDRILRDWNDTDEPVTGGYFHEQVSARARQTPEATAVSDPTGQVTYAELDHRATRLANHLRDLGVGPGARAGVFLERGADNLVAQLAVIRLGAAVVLLDPEYPDERLAFMLSDASAVAVLTRTGLRSKVGSGPWVVLAMDDKTLWKQATSAAPLKAPVVDDTVCHIAYTSGSTGKPKAVVFRHGALRALIHTLRSQCEISPGARGTWLCSPGFGLVEVDCFPILASGGTVCVPEPAIASSAQALRDWLIAEKITHTLLLTSIAERVWALGWPAGTTLRNMRVAGERLRDWPPVDLPYEVLNVYGSAEATVVATCRLVSLARELGGAERVERRPPVGRPAPNVRAYVLDAGLDPVPPGVLGELYVSGASLGHGYLGRPDANTVKFLPNHVPGDPHPVLYRSGDIARYWADGTIEIVGRADNEVKIRGYRVHLGEVESALVQQPGVREAAVLAREDHAGEKRLVAYVATDAGGAPLVRELRRALRRTLPSYMVPSAFVVTGELPITANGKIDRAALPPPPRTRPDLDTTYLAPRDDVESWLADLFGEILDIDEVGVLDSFLELGGDSLRAMRLLTRLREEHQLELGMDQLYEAPSVAAFARVVQRAQREQDGGSLALPTIDTDASQRFAPFPLTENQQALWIGRGDAVELGNVGAHGYFEWEQHGLDVDRFRKAWRGLLDVHDMLRAIIRPDGTQQILPDVPGDGITVTDLRGLSAHRAGVEIDRLREEMSHQVISSDTWPLYDVRLTMLDAGRTILHFGLDMLIMDAWSAFQVLFPDLIELYENPAAALPAPEVSFRDYVINQRAALTSVGAYQRSREYWLGRLESLPPAPDLPMLTAPRGTLRFDRREFALPAGPWKRLKERANEARITPSGLLVAVFAEVLRAWSGNERFTINFPIFDRAALHPQIHRVLGDFTNTLLVAVEKTDGMFVERARDIAQQMWRDLEHRHFTGVEVLRELARRGGGALRPAMPIVVTSLLGQPPRRQVSALGRETYGISQTPQVLIDFQIREIDEVLHFKWDFLDAMFPPGLVEAMFEAYCGLVTTLVDDDSSWQADRFDLLPARQRQARMLANRTATPVAGVLLHELLADQSERRPQAIAIASSRARLTYLDLFRQANRIGHALRHHGAQPNQLVAVIMEKGWEQYAAVYGILTAGAAYLPVDASVPNQRLRYLLDNAEVDLVLTQPWLAGRLDVPERTRVLCVGGGHDGLGDFAGFPHLPLASVQQPIDLAYVIYTSGSTGAPKGVMVDHRGVVNHVLDVNRRFGIGPHDRALATAGLHFDMSVYDIFGIIAAGATAVLPDPMEVPDAGHWVDLAHREGVTFWACVPALMQMATDWAARHGADLSTLKRVVLAGDWIPLSLPDRIREIAPAARVVSCGGPTETINWSIVYPIGSVDPSWASIPYGRPMANQRYHILDTRLRDRPDWVPGQMIVSSDVGLSHGYWRDEEQTRKRFFRLPTGERGYATGDLGRYLPDGTIEILGRDDLQVKIQGHRIELGEIESVLAQAPQAQTAAVVAAADPSGRRRLTAFVVAEPGQTAVDPAALAEFLRERLPGYLVPADIRVIAELPLTRNGKIDRTALTELAAHRVTRGDADQAWADPVAQILAGLCADVLGLGSVGVNDNFFQIGGDSLSGTRYAAHVSEALGIDVPLRMVFARPTATQLSAALTDDPQYCAAVAAFADALASLTDEDLDEISGVANAAHRSGQ